MKKRKLFLNDNAASSLESSSFFIGINLSSNLRKLEASLIGTSGSGKDAPIILYKSVAFDLPDEVSQVFNELKQCVPDPDLEAGDLSLEAQGRFSPKKDSLSSKKLSSRADNEETPASSSLAKLSNLRIMNTIVQEEAVLELLKDVNVSKDNIIAIAVSDPGIWLFSTEWDHQQTFFSLSDSLALSRRTGLNVIDSLVPNDAFLSRQGLLLFPYWILLGDSERDKLIIDLGETARWYYIPSSRNGIESTSKLLFDNTISCGSLLNLLTKQASKGEFSIDVGGRLSVQGRCINELVDFWREGISDILISAKSNLLNPSLSQKIISETYYLKRLLSFNSRQKVSSVDALCSAVHMIADQIIESVREKDSFLTNQNYDVVLTGASKQNGLLFSRLSSAIAPHGVHTLNEYGCFDEESFDSVALAVLGLLFTIGVPALLYKEGRLEKVMKGRLVFSSEVARNRMSAFQTGQ
jgi:hypothetical protein